MPAGSVWRRTISLVALLISSLQQLGAAAADVVAEADAQEPKSDILEVMSWCKGVQDILDWGQVLKLAKKECTSDAEEEDVLRIRCTPAALVASLDAARLIMQQSGEVESACANGLVFILAVVLAYLREALTQEEIARGQVLLWQALQENFMLDASVWPVKTFDVLQLFDRYPAALTFPPLEEKGLSAVTIVAPRCPALLARAILERFPEVRVAAGISQSEELEVPGHWIVDTGAAGRPSGATVNKLLAQVETPLALVVIGSGLPAAVEDVERMARVLRDRRLLAVGGPFVSEKERVYSDFCYRLKLRHYRLSFDPMYQHSVVFDESSASAIRGNWFREEDAAAKDGPCKLCDTLPPTFLARTSALRAVGFHPGLDGEWALLDLTIRATRTPVVEVLRGGGARGGEGASEASIASGVAPREPGRRHTSASFAVCPFVQVREVPGLAAPHLYARGDLPPDSGVSPSEAWFGAEAGALGQALSGRPDVAQLRPAEQAKLFMGLRHLREFRGPEGTVRHFGCNLEGANCAVPDWVYRGWAAPPCCKETMRHLLFYIDDVFRELGIRYIVTDGVLLGSYKFGGMIDWDADVDLHIHSEDFYLLEQTVQHRVKEDGHFLRKHVNNQSWLLQANKENYLLIELNERKESWDPERVWQVPIEHRLFPAMEEAHINLSSWYGLSFFRHRLRHVPEWEEESRPMYCATPYHYNCVDETQVPAGQDCLRAGVC